MQSLLVNYEGVLHKRKCGICDFSFGVPDLRNVCNPRCDRYIQTMWYDSRMIKRLGKRDAIWVHVSCHTHDKTAFSDIFTSAVKGLEFTAEEYFGASMRFLYLNIFCHDCKGVCWEFAPRSVKAFFCIRYCKPNSWKGLSQNPTWDLTKKYPAPIERLPVLTRRWITWVRLVTLELWSVVCWMAKKEMKTNLFAARHFAFPQPAKLLAGHAGLGWPSRRQMIWDDCVLVQILHSATKNYCIKNTLSRLNIRRIFWVLVYKILLSYGKVYGGQTMRSFNDKVRVHTCFLRA